MARDGPNTRQKELMFEQNGGQEKMASKKSAGQKNSMKKNEGAIR
ncbi:hypothetical protein ACFL2U_00540 [Patescibacteria group bacterium]